MKIGMVGLDRMGASLAARPLQAGHPVVAFDQHAEKAQALASEGAIGVSSAERFASRGAEVFADGALSAMRLQCDGHEERRS